jgi:hypothetical protein
MTNWTHGEYGSGASFGRFNMTVTKNTRAKAETAWIAHVMRQRVPGGYATRELAMAAAENRARLMLEEALRELEN